MDNDLGQWQWVDEDPFEKLLHGPKDAGVAGSHAETQVECLEPVCFDEAPGHEIAAGNSESDQTVAQLSPLVCAENLEEPLQSPVEAIAVNGHAGPVESDPVAPAVELHDFVGHTIAVNGHAGPVESDSVAPVVELHDFAGQFDQAISLEKLEQWEEAANAFRLALEVDPGHAEALIGLGACLLHLDAAEEALECFKQCLFSDVGRKRALLGKAVALQKLTRYDDADRTYRELLQAAPDSPEPLANLIALSVARRDTAAVAEYSRRLLRVDPTAKAALQGLATLAIWDGNQTAAVDYCTRLVEIDPISFEGWHNLAFAKQKMHPPEQAMRSIA
jgi:Flp pilus assembly protein TadD